MRFYELVDGLRKELKNKSIKEEFFTGGALGQPMPGTYEEEYGPFRKKGSYRITAMTNETVEETITLRDLYNDGMPDRDENIWNYISPSDLDHPFEINVVRPQIIEFMLLQRYGVDDIEDLFNKMTEEQKELIDEYKNSPDLSKNIIVLSQDFIVDGNHRAVAAVLANKPLRYIDLTEPEE